jgi:hypothetical protein
MIAAAPGWMDHCCAGHAASRGCVAGGSLRHDQKAGIRPAAAYAALHRALIAHAPAGPDRENLASVLTEARQLLSGGAPLCSRRLWVRRHS